MKKGENLTPNRSVPRLNNDTGFDPNPDFMFDVDGGIVTTDGPGSATRPDTASVARIARAGSELSALERVRQDQEDADRARAVRYIVEYRQTKDTN